MRLLSNSFGREEKNEDNEEPLSDELTANFQTRYLHRRDQENQKETSEERPKRDRPSSEDQRSSHYDAPDRLKQVGVPKSEKCAVHLC